LKKFIVPFVFLFTLFVSCSKEDTDSNAVNSCDKIVEALSYHPYENPNYQTTATIQYDEKGRLKTIIGGGQNKSEYTYFKDRIELKATDIFGDDISITYYLDNAQRVIRTSYYNNDYKYNADGYLIAYKQPYGYNDQINGYTQYYLKYENGNLIEVYTPDQNVSRKKVTFEYYNEPNQDLMGYNSPFYTSNIIYDRNTFYLLQGGYFGKQSKNLLKSVDYHEGYPIWPIKYGYDQKGRITKIEEGYIFKYQCP
jgi:hypothetical protein